MSDKLKLLLKINVFKTFLLTIYPFQINGLVTDPWPTRHWSSTGQLRHTSETIHGYKLLYVNIGYRAFKDLNHETIF